MKETKSLRAATIATTARWTPRRSAASICSLAPTVWPPFLPLFFSNIPVLFLVSHGLLSVTSIKQMVFILPFFPLLVLWSIRSFCLSAEREKKVASISHLILLLSRSSDCTSFFNPSSVYLLYSPLCRFSKHFILLFLPLYTPTSPPCPGLNIT